jgi:hypothetical protein
MTLADVIIFMLLLAVTILITYLYVDNRRFGGSLQFVIMLLGILWLWYGFFAVDTVMAILGVEEADALYHDAQAKVIARYFEYGEFDAIRKHGLIGNNLYQVIVGCFYGLTGATSASVKIINGFFGFWGGLTLARLIYVHFPPAVGGAYWSLVIIFFPSVVFWTTSNLKEGLMYWSICQTITLVVQRKYLPVFFRTWPVALAVVLGLGLRPHVMLGWIASLSAVLSFRRGRRIVGVFILLAAIPLTVYLTAMHVNVSVSPTAMLDAAASQGETLESVQMRKGEQGGGSRLEYVFGGPVPFLSGFISMLFRPFPWSVGSLRQVVSSLETYLTTFIMLGALLLSGRAKPFLLRNALVKMSIISLGFFCLFFTYVPNEGLMIRQKVQALPSIFILAFMPIYIKKYLRYSRSLNIGVPYARYRVDTL